MRLLTCMLLVLPLTLIADDTEFELISKALKKGDITSLSVFFDVNIDLAILDEEDTYNKTEATKLLQNFFNNHSVNNFSLVHEGASPNKGSHYCIGKLNTNDGSFRVYVYMKKEKNNFTIQELRVEED